MHDPGIHTVLHAFVYKTATYWNLTGITNRPVLRQNQASAPIQEMNVVRRPARKLGQGAVGLQITESPMHRHHMVGLQRFHHDP